MKRKRKTSLLGKLLICLAIIIPVASGITENDASAKEVVFGINDFKKGNVNSFNIDSGTIKASDGKMTFDLVVSSGTAARYKAHSLNVRFVSPSPFTYTRLPLTMEPISGIQYSIKGTVTLLPEYIGYSLTFFDLFYYNPADSTGPSFVYGDAEKFKITEEMFNEAPTLTMPAITETAHGSTIPIKFTTSDSNASDTLTTTFIAGKTIGGTDYNSSLSTLTKVGRGEQEVNFDTSKIPFTDLMYNALTKRYEMAISVGATTTDGNGETVSKRVPFVLYAVGPTLLLETPANLSLGADQYLPIKGKYKEGSGVVKTLYKIEKDTNDDGVGDIPVANHSNKFIKSTMGSSENENFNKKLKIIAEDFKATGDGRYVVTVWSRDENGFQSSLKTASFDVDTQGPTITIRGQSEKQTVTKNPIIKFGVDTSDLSGVNKLSYKTYKNTAGVILECPASQASCKYQDTVTTSSLTDRELIFDTTSDFVNGDKILVEVTAEDRKGNKTIKTITATVKLD